MVINEGDKNFTLKYFPELKFVEENGILFLRGRLNFNASFNDREYIIYNYTITPVAEKVIKDSYDIEINLDPSKNIYREVKETGGRIYAVAREKNKPPNDLHIYPNTSGKVCVIGYLDEDQDISFKTFLGTIVIPFFYDQSFFVKYGTWPRSYYRHGCPGMLENYYDLMKDKLENLDRDMSIKCIKNLREVYELYGNDKHFKIIKKRVLYKKSLKPNWKCICGKSNFKNCDSELCLGLKILHKNIKELKLKKYFINVSLQGNTL